jgi:CRP-like cAMP-binding protein
MERRGPAMSELQPRGGNRILQRLSAEDFSQIKPHLRKFSLDLGVVLHPAGAPIEQVYFPASGMVSLVTPMKSGDAIETGIVGREGVVGGAVAANGGFSFSEAIVQMPGLSWRVDSARFTDAYNASAPFRTLVNNFQSVVLIQAQQTAGCHAFHTVEARLCRWLLHSQDLMESDVVTLTQEFLSHMLGVQRTSVSLSAHKLQNAGLIRYARGQITILDRDGLEETSCECYRVIREQIDKAVPPLN